jgi:hypothetical protein
MRMLGGSRVANIEAWRPSTGEVTTLRRLDASSAIGPSPRGVATWSGERGSLLEVDPATGEAVSHEVDWWWNDDFASAAPVVSARGSSVAWLDGRRRGKGERRGTWHAVFVAPVGTDGVVGRPNAVGADWSPHGVLGWLDERNLLVEATPTPILGPEPERRILVVDVETGQSRPGVGRPASYEDLDAIAVATDLLEHPLVESQGRPLGVLRLVLAGLSLLMLGVGLRQWRNRRQERALATGGEQ